MLVTLVSFLAFVIISTGLLQNSVLLIQLCLATAMFAVRTPSRGAASTWRRLAHSAPAVSILAPAFNEERSITESVRSLLALHYPLFDVIVINDGSTDDTLGVLIRDFGLSKTERAFDQAITCQTIRSLYAAEHQPRLLVVDKVNGGKADALNAGLMVARSPIFCAVDADSILAADALLRAVEPFIEDPSRVVAVGGAIRVINGCSVEAGEVTRVDTPRNLWALFQTVEYLRAFLMGRLAWSKLGALTVISGAFGVFRRDLVLTVGGYTVGTVGEDLELVMKLHRHCRDEGQPYRIVFEPDPVCWTEVPETQVGLARQRARWQRGALETFVRHEDMLFNPRYGRIGAVGLPHMLLIDVLGPLTEVAGYVLLPALWLCGLLSPQYLEAFLGVSVGFGVSISVGSLALEETRFRTYPRIRNLVILLLVAVLENFGYRQLSNVWRLRGAWEYVRGTTAWGVVSRRGFKTA